MEEHPAAKFFTKQKNWDAFLEEDGASTMGDILSVSNNAGKANKPSKSYGQYGMTRGQTAELAMLTVGGHIYHGRNKNKNEKVECKEGMCGNYAINNAAGRPIVTGREYKQHLSKTIVPLSRKVAQANANKYLDSRKSDFEKEVPPSAETLMDRASLLKDVGKGKGETGSPGFHIEELMRHKNMDPKRTSKISMKGSYVIGGTTAQQYTAERGGHAIAVRDGMIYDNNFSIPIPYTRKNLYKILNKESVTIYKVDTTTANPAKLIPTGRSKRKATKEINYSDQKRRRK